MLTIPPFSQQNSHIVSKTLDVKIPFCAYNNIIFVLLDEKPCFSMNQYLHFFVDRDGILIKLYHVGIQPLLS